ncbi:MAG: type II toxin-antitoxin system PemK/MazF family toxin [Candidatus Saccharimonadales bacterium]
MQLSAMVSKPIRRGEIYWVNFDPTVGSEIQKKRPALIVSNDVSNLYSPLVTVLPISSKVSKPYPFEVLVEAGISGLKIRSLIKANQIRTVDKQRLTGPAVGRISNPEILAAVELAIKIHLTL